MALKLLYGSRVAGVDVKDCACVGNVLGAFAGSEVADNPVALENCCWLPEQGAKKQAELTLIWNFA